MEGAHQKAGFKSSFESDINCFQLCDLHKFYHYLSLLLQDLLPSFCNMFCSIFLQQAFFSSFYFTCCGVFSMPAEATL